VSNGLLASNLSVLTIEVRLKFVMHNIHASLAQLGERNTVTVEVRGSKPLRGAKLLRDRGVWSSPLVS
jgi:hypothetical protein